MANKEDHNLENEFIQPVLDFYEKKFEAMTEALDRIEGLAAENGRKLDLTNGNVGRNRKKIDDHDKAIKAIQDNDIFEDGFRKGIFSMKSSTRNMILVIIAAAGLYFAGVREIRHYKTVEMASLKEQLNSKSHQLEAIEQWFKVHNEPVTESDIAEKLKKLLKNNH